MDITAQEISLSELHESPWNPRKHFPEKPLEELAQSMREVNVLSPLVVRPRPAGGYEIAAGHRRRRAALLAKLDRVPCIVRPLTDQQLLEILTIENMAREDVHPLDEGEGYRTLMKQTGWDADAVAAKVGKSKSYVYQRLKLAELIEPAKKAFLEENITAGHAILIARLQPKDQAEALKYCEGNKWDGPASVRDLSQHIQRDIHLDLSGAPWKKDDATLVPAAGPCTTCPKRTGFSPDLFPDIAKKDTCTDRACFQAKGERFLARKLEAAAAAGETLIRISTEYGYNRGKESTGVLPADRYREAKPGSCAHAKKALIVEGRDLGQIKTICADKSCKTHRGYVSTGRDDSWRKRLRREQEKRARETDRLRRILASIHERATGKLTRADLELIAIEYFCDLWADLRTPLLKLEGWLPEGKRRVSAYGDAERLVHKKVPELKDSELTRFLVCLSLIKSTEIPAYGPGRPADALLAAAKRWGVNVAKIDAAIKVEADEKARKQKAREKKAKAKAKSDGKADPTVIKLEDICKLHGGKAPTKKPKPRRPEKPASRQTGKPANQKTVHTSAP